MFVIPQEYKHQGNTADISWISLIRGKGVKNTVIIVVLEHNKKTYLNFGNGLIGQQEAIWLAREISAFLEQIRR
ncbi:hypothetical protein [Pleurocapsa sp. PCC 7319]|uniref:hypothetical protein n=1 Tax=Pleurocapsa sp. PCC 7319 TaxID=118161 RepID=UPI001181A907|nr:hypothetical protein [Pleurocapsa sp. PCC 7319]